MSRTSARRLPNASEIPVAITLDPTGSAPGDRQRLARAIEHTLLRPETTAADVERLCAEAKANQFHCVCVNGSRVVQAADLLDASGVKVATTIGFPFGATDADSKRFEVEAAIDNGGHEIDVVMNIGRFKITTIATYSAS